MNRPANLLLTLLAVALFSVSPCAAAEAPRTTRGKDKDGWTHLVFVKPLSYSVGFGRLGWHRGDQTRTISIGGKRFDMAFDAHATSSIKFKLSRKCTRFHASYGLKTGSGGAAVFVILADGKEVFRTGEIYGYGPTHDRGTRTPVELDVTGVRVLELRALAVRGGAGAWSCWGDPKVQ